MISICYWSHKQIAPPKLTLLSEPVLLCWGGRYSKKKKGYHSATVFNFYVSQCDFIILNIISQLPLFFTPR